MTANTPAPGQRRSSVSVRFERPRPGVPERGRWAGLRVMSIRLATLVFLLTAMRASAQVYSIGVGSPVSGMQWTVLRVDEHRWLAGSVGLVQFRARSGQGTPWIRQTTIQLGTSGFTVRFPVIASIGYAALIIPTLLITLVAGEIYFHRRP